MTTAYWVILGLVVWAVCAALLALVYCRLHQRIKYLEGKDPEDA